MTTPFLKAAAIAALVCSSTVTAQSSCNPTKTTCPAQPGLASGINVDFTKATSFSDIANDWTLAAYENVTFDPTNGATFTFNKVPDSPYIYTTDYFLFGHVDVTLQAATGAGIISAVTLISDSLDEIDWEFSGNNFGAGNAAGDGKVQTNYFGKGIVGTYDRGTLPGVATPQTEFHTYSLDWTADSLTWSIDGQVVRTLLASDANDSDHQYPQSPMQVHIGAWCAGCAGQAPGTIAWSGGPTDLTQAPFTYYVRSVVIEPASSCSSYTYTDMSGSASSIQCGAATANATSSSSISGMTQTTSTVHMATSEVIPTMTPTLAPVTGAGTPTSSMPVPVSTGANSPSLNETITINTCTTSTPTVSASVAPAAGSGTSVPAAVSTVSCTSPEGCTQNTGKRTPSPAPVHGASPNPITSLSITTEGPFPALSSSIAPSTASDAPTDPKSTTVSIPSAPTTSAVNPVSNPSAAETAPTMLGSSTGTISNPIGTYTPSRNGASPGTATVTNLLHLVVAACGVALFQI